MINKLLSDAGHEATLSTERSTGTAQPDPFAECLQEGPLEFLQAAEASPSLRAMRYTFEGEQMLYLDLALATYYKFMTQRAPANERLSELLQDIIHDSPRRCLLAAEANCLLAVYDADSGDLRNSVQHYQRAVDTYAALDRPDALAVCFGRHALTLFEHGYFREADHSLLQAQQFALNSGKAPYVRYCQLVQSVGSVYQGRVDAAAQSAKSISVACLQGPGEQALYFAMQFRIAVERDELDSAESSWQALLALQAKGIPVGAIATRTRVALLLTQGQFSDATDVVLHFLHGSPLASVVSKHQLMLDLIKHPLSSAMAHSVRALFEELLNVNERAIRQDPGLEVGLSKVNHPQNRDGSLSHA